MEKICINPKCGKTFSPKNPKGEYCSTPCRSAHHYALKTGRPITNADITDHVDRVRKKDKLLGKVNYRSLVFGDEELRKEHEDLRQAHQKLLEANTALESKNKELAQELADLKGKAAKNQNTDISDALRSGGMQKQPENRFMLSQRQKKCGM